MGSGERMGHVLVSSGFVSRKLSLVPIHILEGTAIPAIGYEIGSAMDGKITTLDLGNLGN